MRRIVALIAATISCAVAAPAAFASDITLHLSSSRVSYGTTVRFAGTVTPAVAGQTVTLSRTSGPVAQVAVSAEGGFAGSFKATRAGALTAAIAGWLRRAPP